MHSDAGWKEVSLGEVVELKRGYDLPKDKRSPGKVPVVSSSGVSGFHSEAMVKGPGVVTGRYGTIGEVFYIADDFWPLNTTLYVRDFKDSDPLFVSYFLRTLDFQSYSDKGAVPGINRNHLHTAKVNIPTINVQKKIASILKSFDGKIDLNRRINQTLEAMAQAIFKSWFVDFDPVKAKITAIEQGEDPLRASMRAISGKTNAELDQLSHEHYDHLAATATLFPEEMEELELGKIPLGWGIKMLGDVLELVYGKALKATDRKQGSIPVYGSGGITGYHNSALVTHGSIVVGRKGTIGSLYWEDGPFFPIDTTYYVRPINVPLSFCYYSMQGLGLDKMNTDAAVPGLNRENAYRLGVIVPKEGPLNAFDEMVSSLRLFMHNHLEENSTLEKLRDTLLPKLLSGELKVSELLGGGAP